ncbi:MAG: hypothetical protein HFI34_06240 [Lachnospiraceae bacterium]|nr:hypothetical protein [Lachnospiraceae bacterium]
MKTTIISNIDFKSGVVEDFAEMTHMDGLVLDVRWKGNVHLRFYHRWSRFWYIVVRNEEPVSTYYHVSKLDEGFFKSVQKLVNEIDNGNFNKKKTQSEKVMEIVRKRNLTGYMNKTKWKEFLYAMTEEMMIAVPYDFKTLFEDSREKLLFGTSYDIESFNYYDFKSIEWVKVKPKFSEHIYQGRLMEDKIIDHDVEKEFLVLMEKYHIPYEYDSSEEVYVIYGYR